MFDIYFWWRSCGTGNKFFTFWISVQLINYIGEIIYNYVPIYLFTWGGITYIILYISYISLITSTKKLCFWFLNKYNYIIWNLKITLTHFLSQSPVHHIASPRCLPFLFHHGGAQYDRCPSHLSPHGRPWLPRTSFQRCLAWWRNLPELPSRAPQVASTLIWYVWEYTPLAKWTIRHWTRDYKSKRSNGSSIRILNLWSLIKMESIKSNVSELE